MALAANAFAALLGFFAAASALSPQFPHGKTVVYKYYGDVKAGIIEPAAYASQFALEGLLHVKHETSDPTLNNAYHVSLRNVKTGMHNGVAAHYQQTKVLTPINDAASVIQDPFLIVYDENGRLQGVKILESEPGWSKNMKMAMASMLQLDLSGAKMEEAASKPRSFIVNENTIYGDCWYTYDVRAKRGLLEGSAGEFVVTKFSSPRNCSGFSVHSFDHVDEESCDIDKEEPVNVASRRVFEIEKLGEETIIKKLVAHGGSNYFPWNARSEAHYVLTNATFALERVVPSSEIDLPRVNFQDVPMTRDLAFRKPETTYAENAAVDVTQGRRSVDQAKLVAKLEKMLGEAADYIDENHLEAKEPDWKHGQTINRMLYTMGYMEIESLQRVLEAHLDSDTPREITIRNMILSMIPHVGTPAGCLLTLSVIRGRRISDAKAIEMLTNLPLNVRVPTEMLLQRMEDLVKLADSISVDVRKSAILCFSSMIHRTMKSLENRSENVLLRRYLDHFFNLVKNEPNYELKLVYLMALRNVEFGNIHELLAPIIRGDLTISENPEHVRLAALWAIEKSVRGDYHFAHDLLWPIMANSELPVKMRIAAYDILMNGAPSMSDVLHIYWFMVYEKNEHLYNYHHTTIDGIANSVDPCKLHLREYTRKIMRFTRNHETIRYALATARIYDWKDELLNHAQKIRTGVILDEATGVPEVLHVEHVVTEARRPVSEFEVRLHVQGCDEIVELVRDGRLSMSGGVVDATVLNLLKRAATDSPANLLRKIHLDLVIARHGRVVLVGHYDQRTLRNLHDDLVRFVKRHKDRLSLNHQLVDYDRLYEKRVTSDMGLAVVYETRVPLVRSLRMNYDSSEETTSKTMNLEVEAKVWRHGDYSMSIYNPMADTWHSIRRATATDLSLPLRATLTWNPRTNSVKITMPRLPATKFSVAGLLTHARDCVTVNEDDTDALKDSCPTCRSQEDVTLGLAAKKHLRTNYDSRDTGLAYSAAVFDCENGATPVTLRAEWYRALFSERKNERNNWLIRALMAIHQRAKNALISPSMGSCGSLVKIEPSIVHPTSHIDVTLRSSFEDVDHVNPTFHLFPSEKYNIRGRLDVVAASTNVTARSWDLNVNVDLEQAHTANTLKIHLTRITPGEKNLKVCVDGQKIYSTMPRDPLKLAVAREETNGKLTISSGETDGDECTRDDTLVAITMKGELSDEQRDELRHYGNDSLCTRDINDSLYGSPRVDLVPKTLGCVEDAIRFTTMRKYSLNIAHKKVPREITSKIQHLEDAIRTRLLANLEYTTNHAEPGNTRINVVFPMDKQEMDVSVVTPARSFDLVDVNFEKPRFEAFGPVTRTVWHLPLDNTRFGIRYLYKYTHDTMKLCSVYPEVVLTGDGANVPFRVTDSWTLVSGDHERQKFAIFVKKVGQNVAAKIYVADRVVEISPNASDDEVRVEVDGVVVERSENGLVVPADVKTWLVKITRHNEHTVVQIKGIPMMIAHGVNHVALAVDTQLQGRISGLCGHLDGTYVREIYKIYEM